MEKVIGDLKVRKESRFLILFLGLCGTLAVMILLALHTNVIPYIRSAVLFSPGPSISPRPAVISASPIAVRLNQNVLVSYQAPAGVDPAKHWIGMYKVGAPQTNYKEKRTPKGISGTEVFRVTSDLGAYVFRYYANSSTSSFITESNLIQVGSCFCYAKVLYCYVDKQWVQAGSC